MERAGVRDLLQVLQPVVEAVVVVDLYSLLLRLQAVPNIPLPLVAVGQRTPPGVILFFAGSTALGGGYGARDQNVQPWGGNGGCGGGGAAGSQGGPGTGSQGGNGGTGHHLWDGCGGGGGGSSSPGQLGAEGGGGAGGSGTQAVDGNYYSGGGGAGAGEENYAAWNTIGPNSGGTGGGGHGCYKMWNGPWVNAVAGTTNSGGGGGGGLQLSTAQPAAGGSGSCFIYYPNTFDQASATTGSPTYSNSGGNHIYHFTGSGTITF